MTSIADAIVFQNLLSFGIFLIIVLVLSSIIMSSKSRKYRKFLADMFVAAKIRKLAKTEELDLVSEADSFKLWSKKERLEYTDLDNSIEDELKEKIAETSSPKKPKTQSE